MKLASMSQTLIRLTIRHLMSLEHIFDHFKMHYRQDALIYAFGLCIVLNTPLFVVLKTTNGCLFLNATLFQPKHDFPVTSFANEKFFLK